MACGTGRGCIINFLGAHARQHPPTRLPSLTSGGAIELFHAASTAEIEVHRDPSLLSEVSEINVRASLYSAGHDRHFFAFCGPPGKGP